PPPAAPARGLPAPSPEIRSRSGARPPPAARSGRARTPTPARTGNSRRIPWSGAVALVGPAVGRDPVMLLRDLLGQPVEVADQRLDHAGEAVDIRRRVLGEGGGERIAL